MLPSALYHFSLVICRENHPRSVALVRCSLLKITCIFCSEHFHDLEAKGRNWHKELPSVLWALHTNINRATRDTPFHLVYGADAVLPPKIFLELAWTTQFNEEDKAEARELDSNLLEEEHNKALSIVQKYQESLKRYYNKSVVPRDLEIGDLVLKKDIWTKDKHKFSSPLGRTIFRGGHCSTRGLCTSRS
jgi:hypothetical protein